MSVTELVTLAQTCGAPWQQCRYTHAHKQALGCTTSVAAKCCLRKCCISNPLLNAVYAISLSVYTLYTTVFSSVSLDSTFL
jgi:hypothetical protein